MMAWLLADVWDWGHYTLIAGLVWVGMGTLASAVSWVFTGADENKEEPGHGTEERTP